MNNENNKIDILKEIIKESNSIESDIKIDTSKFGDIMKEFQEPKKKNIIKHSMSKKLLNFNFDEALSTNMKDYSEKFKTLNSQESNISLTNSITKENKYNIGNNIFDKADDILNNFNIKCKNKKESDNILNMLENNKNKQLFHIENDKLNTIKEENENIKDDAINNNKENDNINKDSNNIIIENKIQSGNNDCIPDMDVNKNNNITISNNSLENTENKEINIIKEKYDENGKRDGKEVHINNNEGLSKITNIEENIKKEEKITNKINEEKNKNIIDETDITNKNNIKTEINKIKVKNKNTNNTNDKEKLEDEPNIEYTGTKIDLVEKTENLYFSKTKNISELSHYLNNKYKTSLSNDNDDARSDGKKTKFLYQIIQSIPDNKVIYEIKKQKITSLFLDNEELIYCGDEKGNLLIYNLKDETFEKLIDNPFSLETKTIKKYPIINSISCDEEFICAGYENGGLSIFLKNLKKPSKTKLYDAFQEISQNKIIETKIYSKNSKKKNTIKIYSCDSQENIYKTKIIKNKIFKNKVYTNRIIGPMKNAKKKEPYYYLEINPFNHKCVGFVNNRGVHIYIIHKNEKNNIFSFKNLDEENSFLSFFFSKKKEKIFFMSNMKYIYVYEINDIYNGVAQQNSIVFNENIIQIGSFINDLIYVFDKNNMITLLNCEKVNEENKKFGFENTINLNKESKASNGEVDNNLKKENIDYILSYKNSISINNGIIFMYDNQKNLFVKSISLYDGLSKIYTSIFLTQSIESWDILFSICISIYKKEHPLWKYEKPSKSKESKESKEFNELCIKLSQSFLSLLIIKLDNNTNSEEFINIINKFNELISFLFEINLVHFIIEEKDNLHSIFLEANLEDLYYYLLEPHILSDKFLKMTNLKYSFIHNLMDIFLYKRIKESKFIKNNKSWLSELLLHFDIKRYLKKEKDNNVLDKIKEYNLVNVIIFLIINYEANEVMVNNFIDYCTPLHLMVNLLISNVNKKSKNKNENEDLNLLEVDLNNEAFFKKEFRFKDEIIFSTEYLRIKILWYIYIILKNRIVKEGNSDKLHDSKKSLFIREILRISFEKEIFNIIVFGDPNNDKSRFLGRELVYILQIICDNDIINKYHEINKEEILLKLMHLFKNRKESHIPLNSLIVKSLANDNRIELSNEVKLDMVLFFMNNNCSNSDIYPEIKEPKFENNLIEILKLIDSFTFDDSEKLLKSINICESNYSKLAEYIKTNFKS